MVDCHAEDITYYLSTDKVNCVQTCNPGEYITGSICKLCSETLANCSICNSAATLCITCVSQFYLTYTSTGCVKSCKEDSSRLLNTAQTRCVTNCASDDSSLLGVTKDKCVTSCGSDILNYAGNECIYGLAGCTAQDEYTTGSP